MLIAVAIMAYQACQPGAIKRTKLLVAGIAICALHWLLSFGLMARSFYSTSQQDQVRIAIIKDGIKNNLDHIEIPEYYFKRLLRSRDKFDVFFNGPAIAKYYGADAEITEYPVTGPYDSNMPPVRK